MTTSPASEGPFASQERLKSLEGPPQEGPQTAPEKPPCKNCKGPLTGRQTKFCSKACNTDWYNTRFPRIGIPIEPAPGRPGDPIRARIFELMSDGRWYTDLELSTALGILEQTAGAKRRDLRKARYGGNRFESRTASRPYSKSVREHRLVMA